jgi:predicted MFS family arabinose efflux permease
VTDDPDRLGTWGAVAGLFVLSAAAAAYEIAPASVTPVVMSDLGVGEPAAGWLVSVMYGVAVLASIPVGIALDRVVVRRAVTAAAGALLLAGVWGWAAAGAGAYWPLVASRVIGGLAYVTIWNAGADLASRSVPGDRAATAVGVFTASAPAGFALGQLGGPVVAGAAGWPAIFPVFGGRVRRRGAAAGPP